ncbi:MAG: SDR family NAD(P)-dependent oxidoreductase, partial [Kiritimatiellaeota bacterium]|nr:SDR family NAD(P)-dependent oxidoreductase [Kiritimatiellota bacterium]
MSTRLQNKVTIVTGAAQGFGEGIARELAANGARLVIADLNLALAEKVAESIGNATAVKVDVTNEESVKNLVDETVRIFGGVDLLVSNAGVLRAGGLDEMTLADFEFVTKVNYTAFFLLTKHVSRVMKERAASDPAYTADIIQINSKSGLEGSDKNFAYA